MYYNNTQAEHFLLNQLTEADEMSIENTIGRDLAELDRGSKPIGRQDLPDIIHMDVREIIEDANIFVGHIADKIKEGSNCTFAVTDENLICSAIVLISDARATDVERNLLTVDLIGKAVSREDVIDVDAIVKAITDVSTKLKEKFKEFRLMDGDLLNYVYSRYEDGQLELVRKKTNDPGLNFAQRGFAFPAWANKQAR